MRKINIEKEIDAIVSFMKNKLAQANMNKLIIGLSGGIDSSVSAALAVKAIGKENVIGVMLPYKNSHPNSLLDAVEVAKFLDIEYQKVDISPMVDSYFETYEPNATILRRGNRMARERMCILYDLSAKYDALVVGTGNKSELLVGYFTQYGDGACAFEPIGNLYKTEVYQLAEFMNLPKSVIEKEPTADLWQDQTDEDEMGISYKNLDEILYNLYDLKMPKEELKAKGIDAKDIELVQNMYNKSEFKRNLPEVPKGE